VRGAVAVAVAVVVAAVVVAAAFLGSSTPVVMIQMIGRVSRVRVGQEETLSFQECFRYAGKNRCDSIGGNIHNSIAIAIAVAIAIAIAILIAIPILIAICRLVDGDGPSPAFR